MSNKYSNMAIEQLVAEAEKLQAKSDMSDLEQQQLALILTEMGIRALQNQQNNVQLPNIFSASLATAFMPLKFMGALAIETAKQAPVIIGTGTSMLRTGVKTAQAITAFAEAGIDSAIANGLGTSPEYLEYYSYSDMKRCFTNKIRGDNDESTSSLQKKIDELQNQMNHLQEKINKAEENK